MGEIVIGGPESEFERWIAELIHAKGRGETVWIPRMEEGETIDKIDLFSALEQRGYVIKEGNDGYVPWVLAPNGRDFPANVGPLPLDEAKRAVETFSVAFDPIEVQE